MSTATPSGRTVAHVIQSVSGAAGGPPVSSSRLAAARAARGHTVRFLTLNPDAPDAVTNHLTGVLDIRKVPAPKLPELFVRGSARKEIAGHLSGCDIVYLHGVWDPILQAAALEARAAGIPYVVIPVGMLDPWSLSQKKWKKRLALGLGGRRMLDRAAAIRALNRDEADLLKPLNLKPLVRVIPNGMNLNEVDPPASVDAFRAAVPAVGDRPYILFLSRLHFKKGLDLLAAAFAPVAERFPDVQLVVAGADDGYRAEFERQVAERGLTNRVHLPGPLYGPAKWSALANAACFCLPSRQEGFSVAILESLASRTPVVITQDCHFPEVAEAGAGLVTPLDANAVAAALEQTLADPVVSKRRGEAGRKLVEDRYTWSAVAALCEDLDRDVLSGNRP